MPASHLLFSIDPVAILALGGPLSPEYLIDTFGTIGVILVIFVESCIFPFLPGDSLLFLAGFLASQGRMNLATLMIGTTLAAIAGNQLGYMFGRRVGPALFSRPDSKLFKQENLEKTHAYFDRYGPKTILLARFIPIVRTFACIVAGVAKMEYRVFVMYNVIGAILWGAGITLVGWIVGKTLGEVVDIDKFLLPVIAIIILLSLLPVGFEYLRHRKEATKLVGEVKDSVQEQIETK